MKVTSPGCLAIPGLLAAPGAGFIVEGAGAATFTVVNERVFQDKNGNHQEGVPPKDP